MPLGDTVCHSLPSKTSKMEWMWRFSARFRPRSERCSPSSISYVAVLGVGRPVVKELLLPLVGMAIPLTLGSASCVWRTRISLVATSSWALLNRMAQDNIHNFILWIQNKVSIQHAPFRNCRWNSQALTHRSIDLISLLVSFKMWVSQLSSFVSSWTYVNFLSTKQILATQCMIDANLLSQIDEHVQLTRSTWHTTGSRTERHSFISIYDYLLVRLRIWYHSYNIHERIL